MSGRISDGDVREEYRPFLSVGSVSLVGDTTRKIPIKHLTRYGCYTVRNVEEFSAA